MNYSAEDCEEQETNRNVDFLKKNIINYYLPYDLAVWRSAEVPEELHDEPLAVSDDVAVVHIFCVDFRELSHLTRDLSQAEKKTNLITS